VENVYWNGHATSDGRVKIDDTMEDNYRGECNREQMIKKDIHYCTGLAHHRGDAACHNFIDNNEIDSSCISIDFFTSIYEKWSSIRIQFFSSIEERQSLAYSLEQEVEDFIIYEYFLEILDIDNYKYCKRQLEKMYYEYLENPEDLKNYLKEVLGKKESIKFNGKTNMEKFLEECKKKAFKKLEALCVSLFELGEEETV